MLEHHRDRELESYARKRQGMPNPAIGYFATVPWLAKALVDLHPEYGLLLHLDHELMDLVQLVVCQESSCRFCYAAVRAMLWAQGMSRDRIRRIEATWPGRICRRGRWPPWPLGGASRARARPARAPPARRSRAPASATTR